MRRNRQSAAIFLLRYRSKSIILILLSAMTLYFHLHAAHVANMNSIANEGKTPGFMVLGMHRSGTSMLSGLLVEGFGYDTGGADMGGSVRPLQGPLLLACSLFPVHLLSVCSLISFLVFTFTIKYDNEKGFYELWDVVNANDEFLRAQNAGWSWNVLDFNPRKAIEQDVKGIISFRAGKSALKFFNKRLKIIPYIQKDPRMCITFPIWLNQLKEKPAIVFTYRHPLEVAMSLNHREKNYETDLSVEHGLLLWITYNMRALQNSLGLCRVFTSNEAILANPKKEVDRVKKELTTKCNVIPPPINDISSEVVDSFVDPKLQHNKHDRGNEDTSAHQHGVLNDFGNGCVARAFDSEYDEKSENWEAERDMYLIAMRVFCDLKSGQAFKEDYEWPDLSHRERASRIS